VLRQAVLFRQLCNSIGYATWLKTVLKVFK
jgi:hypothetical protein